MRFLPIIAALSTLSACRGLQSYSPYADDADTDGARDTDQGGPGGDDSGWGSDTDGEDTDDGGGPGGGGGANRVTLGFWQDFDFFYDYQSKGHHEVLIGPESSSDPKDGSWVVAVSAADLASASTGNGWEALLFDLTGEVRAAGWPRFRLAFHYRADNADTWFLDDVCLASIAIPASQADCDLGFEGFEVASYPRLPAGWTNVRGATHQGIYKWETSAWYHGGYQAAEIHFSIDTIDQYLVSTAIDAP